MKETVQKSVGKTEIQLIEAVQENLEQESVEMKMKVQVGDTVFTATLAENSSVDADEGAGSCIAYQPRLPYSINNPESHLLERRCNI